MTMNLGKCARWLLVLLPLASACKGFWSSGSSSGTSGSSGGSGSGGSGSGCTANCNTANAGVFYVLNEGTVPQIIGGIISSGTFGNIVNSPWSLASPPFAMAMAPSGYYLYVGTVGGVYAYPISTSGALGTVTQPTQDPAIALQVDTSGNWLLEAVQTATGSVTMSAIPISSVNGSPDGSEVSSTYTVNGAVQPGKMAVSPDDKYVFVSLGTGGTLALPFVPTVGPGVSPFENGTVIPAATSGGSALSVAVDPGGHLLFIGETLAGPGGSTGGLRVFNYSSLATGNLTQVSGSPLASGGQAPTAIFPKPTGDFVFVANGQGVNSAGNITSFSITASGSTYTVATASTVATGIQPISLAEDSSDTYLFVVNTGGDPFFSPYTFDAKTAGKLDPQTAVNTGATPVGIVAP